MRVLFASTLLCAAALGQGTDPKPEAADYPVHAEADRVSIGAEYNVRSVPTGSGIFLTQDYLVVEVAIYPPPGGTTVNAQQWTLRLNGKKNELLAQTPGMVAASMKYPDWTQRPRVVAGAGPVIFGQPAPVGRFPGDNRPVQNRLPGQIPQAPTRPDTGVEQEPVDMSEVIARAALPEGPHRGPVSGLLFFPWRGKPEKIKSVELILRTESGSPLTMRLR